MSKGKSIVSSGDFSMYYSEGLQAVVKTPEPGKTKKLEVPDSKENAPHGEAIIQWGTDNLFPQKVSKECRHNTVVGTTLDKMARIAYEAGIEYGKVDVSSGEKRYTEDFHPDIEAFFKKTKINRYLIGALRNFYWFYSAFPELVLTKDRKKIYSLRNQKAMYCRYGKPEKGELKYCYVNADWEGESDPKAKHVEKVPLVDVFEDAEALRQRRDGFKYIFPLSYPTENEDYYPLADWNSLRSSGWLDVAKSIPKFKKALFENQMTIKYLIHVPSYWWKLKYDEWEDYTTEKRLELQHKEIKAFEEFMKGEEKSGNSLMLTRLIDVDSHKEFAGWTIEAIDNKIKDGIYIEDSNEASSHLLFALGVDKALLGSQPGKQLGGGSGSDKRVAFNIYTETIKAHQDIILEPLYFINEYNGWEMDYFRFKNLKTEDPQPSQAPIVEPQQQAT